MSSQGDGDPRPLERRALARHSQAMEVWLANPTRLRADRADKDAEYKQSPLGMYLNVFDTTSF